MVPHKYQNVAQGFFLTWKLDAGQRLDTPGGSKNALDLDGIPLKKALHVLSNKPNPVKAEENLGGNGLLRPKECLSYSVSKTGYRC